MIYTHTHKVIVIAGKAKVPFEGRLQKLTIRGSRISYGWPRASLLLQRTTMLPACPIQSKCVYRIDFAENVYCFARKHVGSVQLPFILVECTCSMELMRHIHIGRRSSGGSKQSSQRHQQQSDAGTNS